jgi:hypothetical protein
MRNAYTILDGNLNYRNILEGFVVGGIIILTWILNKFAVYWIRLAYDRIQ